MTASKRTQAMPINLPKLVTGELANNAPAGTPVIVTHDGRFHCDDALAVGMLLSLPEYSGATVVRTRNQELIDRGTVVVDVGGIYDPTKLRFDHHHRGFTEYFDPEWRKVTIMSSAGMVFKHLGRRILVEAFKVDPVHVDVVMKKIYEYLVESVDAIDNGLNVCPKGTEPLYMVRSDLASRVARLNEEWNEWSGDSVAAADFTAAIRMAMEEFAEHVRVTRDAWLPARNLVERGVKGRFDTHPSGRIIELDIGCPFEDHLEELEQGLETKGVSNGAGSTEQHPQGPILFAVYPNTEDKSSWRVKAVRASKASFGNRMDLPERLAGCRKDKLVEMGFPGVSFVHNARFLAGCDSRDACMLLVDKTLREAKVWGDQ